MKTLPEGELAQALASSKVPVAVAFVRVSAAPSAALLESLRAVEAKLAGRVELVQADLDACPSLVAEHRIHREPELLVWAAGGTKLLARTEGEMRADEALGLLEHALTRA